MGSYKVPSVHIRNEVIAGQPCTWVNYPGVNSSKTSPIILYAHGGGGVCGSTQDYAGWLWVVSKLANIRILGVDFPLAPEFPLPAGPESVLKVYEALVNEHHVPPKNIVLMGDSGGGFIIVHTLRLIKEKQLPLPSCTYLNSPMLDATMSLPSHSKNSGREFLMVGMMPIVYASLCPTIPKNSPQCSGLHPDNLRNLPPMFIAVGEPEILFDDSLVAAKTLENQGVQITLDIIPHGIHALAIFGEAMPESYAANVRATEWIKKQIKS